MSRFSNIPSLFDKIIPDHPIVFISYSWDNEDHKKWVKKLADDLRKIYHVNVLLDQYIRPGFDSLEFMREGITKSHRVLLIGTPLYKQKCDDYNSGGCKYEYQIISAEIYRNSQTAKFIPILRSGTATTSFSSLIQTRIGFTMINDYKVREFRSSKFLWLR